MMYYFDTECWENYYLLIWKDSEGNYGYHDTQSDIINWIESKTDNDHLISKNGLKYDWPMLIKLVGYDGPNEGFTTYMREVNDKIIVTKEIRMSAVRMKSILGKRFPFIHTDIQELLNMYANLKRAAGALGFHDVRESNISFSYKGNFTKDMKLEARTYGWVDCDATEWIFKHPETQTEITSRKIMKEVFGVDVQGLGRPRAMSAIIAQKFYEQTGQSIWDAKSEFFTPPRKLHFGKIMTDPRFGKNSLIKFESEELEDFRKGLCKFVRPVDALGLKNTPLNEAKSVANLGINPITGRKKKYWTPKPILEQFEGIKGHKMDICLTIADKIYRIKEGGLHSEHDGPTRFISNDREQLYEMDFSAFYPSEILKFEIFPHWMKQMGFDIQAIYKEIVDKNLDEKAKKDGDYMLRYVYKIISNLFYGKYGELTDPLGDIQLQLKVCLTGQCVLLRMIEKMENAGIPCVYANTDGIVVQCPRGLKDRMLRIMGEISNTLDIGIDAVPIRAIFLKNCNSYLWLLENGKKKGIKDYSTRMSMSNPTLRFPIVPIAVERYLELGIPVEETLRGHDRLLDFCEIKSHSSAAINVRFKPGETVTEELKDKIKLLVESVANLEGENRGDELKRIIRAGELGDIFEVHQKNLRYYHSISQEGVDSGMYKIAHSGKSAGQLSRHSLAKSCTLRQKVRDDDPIPDDLDIDFYVKECGKLTLGLEPAKKLEDIFGDVNH